MTRHAIITDKYMVDREGFSSMNNHLSIGLDGLCELATQNGFTHVWLHPASEIRYGGEWLKELMEKAGYDCLFNFDDTCNLVSLHGYKKLEKGRKGPRFNIIFLEHSTWDWSNLTPPQILKLITDLESNLGVAVSGSPSGTGMRYLQKVTESRPQWLAKSHFDLSSLPWNAAARPLIWQRQPNQDEIESRFLVAFDKNAAYPRAAKEEQQGIGEPVHWGNDVSFDPNLPGMWRIDILHSPDLDERLPSPVWNNFDWLATPIVKLLIKMGHEIAVQEAWIFPKKAHVFRQWTDNLWNLRREREGYERDAYKSIMNDTIGLTRSNKLGTKTFKFRPDWNMMFVAGARAVMMYNIMKYVEKGCFPIMCQLDALYYLTNEYNPYLAVPEILNHNDSLGGYKIKFCIPTDAIEEGMTVRAILASNKPQSQKLRLINKIAERYGYDG